MATTRQDQSKLELDHVYTMDVMFFLDRLKREAQQFDLAIIDPPYYGVGPDYGNEWQSDHDYLGWLKVVMLGVRDVMRPGGSVYLWGAIGYNQGYVLPRLAHWIEVMDVFRVVNWITQRNTRGYGSKHGYVAAREELIYMTVPGAPPVFNVPYRDSPIHRTDLGANGKPRTNTNRRVTDVWIDITEASQYSTQRFTRPDGETFKGNKALALCERIIEASSNPGDSVLVPFCGTGSEVVMAEWLNRYWIACDADPWSAEITKERLYEDMMRR